MVKHKGAWLRTIQASPLVSPRLRRKLLNLSGASIGWGSLPREGCYFGSSKLVVGERRQISIRCLFDNWEVITLEDNVRLACNVSLITSTHEQGLASKRGGALVTAPITIGKGCWIGANVTVLPGVTIAPGCIIAAGAVVHSSTEADGLYAGVPARRVKDLPTG